MKQLLLILLPIFIFSGCKLGKTFGKKETETQKVLIDGYRYETGFLTDLVGNTVALFGLFGDGDVFDLENGIMDAKYYLDKIQPFYYQEELFTGVIFDKYKNGKLAVEASYKDGILHGTFKFWNKNGELAWDLYNENGLRIQEVRYFESTEMMYVTECGDIKVSTQKKLEIKVEDGIVRVKCWDIEDNTKICLLPILF